MSKARKNELKKGYREKERERKRFTEPLPIFLETKYPCIYNEYKELYDRISSRHGKKRNLVKTSTFKNWKINAEYQRAESASTTTGVSDSEAQGNEEEASETTSKTVQHQQLESASTTGVNEDRASQDQAVEIVMPASVDEDQATEQEIRMDINQLADIMVNVEGQVDQIINELREDPYLRNIMEGVEAEVETQADDEGIDISPLDNIEFDIEPFDFALELENYEW